MSTLTMDLFYALVPVSLDSVIATLRARLALRGRDVHTCNPSVRLHGNCSDARQNMNRSKQESERPRTHVQLGEGKTHCGESAVSKLFKCVSHEFSVKLKQQFRKITKNNIIFDIQYKFDSLSV